MMRRLVALFCSVVLVAGLAGCGTGDSDNTLQTGINPGGTGNPTNNAAIDPVPTPTVTRQDVATSGMTDRELAFASEVFELVNAYRVQVIGAGSELTWWGNMAAVSQLHNQAMRTTGNITHASIAGDPGPVPCADINTCPRERVNAYGATLGADMFNAAGVRENIAMGHRTAAEVVQAWQLSPGHDAALRNPAAMFIGIGYLEGPSPANPNFQGPWWTLMTADAIAVP